MGTSIEEYDDFRPCFFESGEDEFYDAPAPSEDIWKKFELLPTPPRSPKHETLYSSVLMPSTLEKLRFVSEMLDDPITKTALSLTDICPPKCMDVCCNFNSKLIHDCMWSGHIVPQELKLGQSTSTDSDRNTSSSSRVRTCSFSLTLDSTSCVDPNVAAVFPYPVNDQTRQIQREGSVGAETPSDSDSDSSEDEEDEEIDVVTVADKVQMAARPRPPTAVSRPVLPPTPTSAVSAQVAAMAMHNYTAAAPRSPKADSSSSSSSSTSHRHSSSTPRSSSSTSRSLVQKRPRHHHHHHHPNKKAKFTLSSKFSVSSSSELRTVIHKYQRLSNNARANAASNRCSSDSEDSDGRRAQHNVLERKRRNDLKSSFHRLRDAVPDLQAQERAAKVTILKKAADHILSIRRTHQTLVTEHDRQKRTNEALQRRLRQLRSK